MNVGTCPVCRIPLLIDKDTKHAVQYCENCRREFYQIKDEQISKLQLEYDDLEPVSKNGTNDGPVLLSSEEDNRFFPKGYDTKKESYLQKYFPSAKITTREY